MEWPPDYIKELCVPDAVTERRATLRSAVSNNGSLSANSINQHQVWTIVHFEQPDLRIGTAYPSALDNRHHRWNRSRDN